MSTLGPGNVWQEMAIGRSPVDGIVDENLCKFGAGALIIRSGNTNVRAAANSKVRPVDRERERLSRICCATVGLDLQIRYPASLSLVR
jgi:hypothetical protein